MARNAPGKHYRKSISLFEFTEMFPDDASAEAWIALTRWPDGPRCPHCDGDRVQHPTTHPSQKYRCRDCKKLFSYKTGTVMQGSNLGARVWVYAIYLLTTGIKGTSSLKLHRDLGIRQGTAWHLAHRIRESWDRQHAPFTGPVEVDETFVGGKAKNMRRHKRQQRRGRGPVGKTPVAGIKDRATNTVSAAVVPGTDGETLKGFVMDHTTPETMVYTDEYPSYRGLPNHGMVRHSVGEYVRDQAHVNGVESFWALLKRGYQGTYHRMSEKHLQRYVDEFAGRHNQRSLDTVDQMAAIARGMCGKRLRYRDLIG